MRIMTTRFNIRQNVSIQIGRKQRSSGLEQQLMIDQTNIDQFYS